MRALAHEPAAVEHENEVRVPDGRDALRDDDLRGAGQVLAEGVAQARVGREVEGARCVVKDEDARVPHERAGYGEALALASGEVPSQLLHLAVEPSLGLHHVGCLGRGDGAFELAFVGAIGTPSQVGGDCARKEARTLVDDALELVQAGEAPVAHVPVAHEHLALRRVIEAHGERRQGRLARPRAADDAHDLAGPGEKAHVRERWGRRSRVGEAHVAELERGRGVRVRSRTVLHGRVSGKDLVDAAGAGLRLGEHDDEVRELEQLDEHLRHVAHEGHHLALREPARVHAHTTHGKHGDEPEVDGHVGERVHEGRDVAHAHLLAPELLSGGIELTGLCLLSTKGAKDAHALKLLGDAKQDAVEAVLDLAVAHDRGAHDEPDEQDHERHDDREDRPLISVDVDGRGKGAKDGDGAAQHEPEEQVHAVLDLVGVVGEPRHEG